MITSTLHRSHRLYIDYIDFTSITSTPSGSAVKLTWRRLASLSSRRSSLTVEGKKLTERQGQSHVASPPIHIRQHPKEFRESNVLLFCPSICSVVLTNTPQRKAGRVPAGPAPLRAPLPREGASAEPGRGQEVVHEEDGLDLHLGSPHQEGSDGQSHPQGSPAQSPSQPHGVGFRIVILLMRFVHTFFGRRRCRFLIFASRAVSILNIYSFFFYLIANLLVIVDVVVVVVVVISGIKRK